MELKIQPYVCTGCGIGDALDAEKLSKVPKELGAPEAIIHPFLCGPDGLSTIRADISAGANFPVIAACSKRAVAANFSFGPDVLVERVNIREGVAWVSEPKSEDAQSLAEDYIKMGVVKAQKTSFPEPFIKELETAVLVVGGGIAGMTAALDVSRAGRNVVLVEKSEKLGGYLGKLKSRFPFAGETESAVDTGVSEKVRAVMESARIKVLTSSVVESISGQPGLFDVIINSAEIKTPVRVGAIIQATGFRPYAGEKLGHLGYGKSPNVVTNAQFEEMAASGKIARPSDGGPVRSAVFIQCAGSRDKNHLAYCSSFCCMTSLKQAAYLREADKSSRAYIFYKDMRTPGKYERFYKKMQDDDGVFMTKADVTAVEPDGNGLVRVSATNTLLGDNVTVNADLVVLAAGIEPNAPDALHLKYRQGPDLPSLNYGFPDSHFICFPYETRRTGIYAAGTVRHPMDAAFTEADAGGAALKALQCVELAAKGKSAHPRSGDTSYPEIAFERCTQCKRCTEECPYGMYDEDEKGTPLPNPLRCRRCGTCMGACPQRIISFKDFHVDMISSMIRAVSVPLEGSPRVLVFVCENDAMPAFDMAGLSRLRLNPNIRVIPLRCLGSLSMVWLNDAFSKGIDGVLLLGCPYGDDYQCHNMKGSELAKERSSKLEETLGRMMLEPDRVRLEQLSINEYHKLPKLIGDFVARMEEIGPNPFKEFGEFA